MKQSEVPLRNMSNIVTTCIVLHNQCILINEDIKEEQIVETKNKLARKDTEGELRERSKLRGKKPGIAKVQRKIMAREDAPIVNKKNGVKTNMFLL